MTEAFTNQHTRAGLEQIEQREFTMTIDGQAASSGEWFEVINPATGQVVARAPRCSEEQRDRAVEAAHRAFSQWRSDAAFRRERLLAIADALSANADTLGAVMTSEQGKPLSEAVADAHRSADWFRYFAGLDTSSTVIQDDTDGFVEVVRKPLGVVVGIIPWNSPLLLIAWKAAPALLAGNTIVIKPSSYTPLSALLIGEILRPLLPEGVFSVVSGKEPLGSQLLVHPLVRKVSFTGSTEVGKEVARNAAADLKRVTLELGGNDAAIVLEDATPDRFARDLFWAAFKNNGQMCALVKRLYVPEAQRAEYVEAIAAVAREVRIGNGMTEGVQLGPLTTQAQLKSISELASYSISSGAQAAAGGKSIEGSGYFFEPTVLTGVTDGDRIVDEEQFGPILPVIGYTDVEDVLRRANNSMYGLGGSVWGVDTDRARTVAARLDSGQASVNHHTRGILPHLPFGGFKWSGLGVENGIWGLDAFTQVQTLAGPARKTV
ncbi:aldehyde dehydrogenase family protein [bacterium RCC_150]